MIAGPATGSLLPLFQSSALDIERFAFRLLTLSLLHMSFGSGLPLGSLCPSTQYIKYSTCLSESQALY